MCTSLMPIDDRDSHTSTRHMHLSWHWSLYGEREAGRGSLVWKMCVRDFTAMYRVSRIIQVEENRDTPRVQI